MSVPRIDPFAPLLEVRLEVRPEARLAVRPAVRRRSSGFSLIEVLGVVALISVVLFVALNFYTDLARATSRASEHTHDIRRAVAILDRVAQDFESAMLIVKPPEVDPISHPWLFIGESQLDGPGSDHVKFITRNHDPTRSDNPESDISVVAYTVEADESGLLSLYRWSAPRLPEELDRSYPFADDEGSFLMADGLETFGIRFIDTELETSDTWDSTTLEQSSTLPAAVEIHVAIADREADRTADRKLDDETEPLAYQRRAVIRLRPLDLEQLLDPDGDPGGTGEDDEEDDDDENDEDDGEEGSGKSNQNAGKTIGDCIDFSGLDGLSRSFLESQSGRPYDSTILSQLPAGAALKPGCR